MSQPAVSSPHGEGWGVVVLIENKLFSILIFVSQKKNAILHYNKNTKLKKLITFFRDGISKRELSQNA